MPRARGGKKHVKRRKKIMSFAKGFKGKRGTSHRIAKQAVMKALRNSYIDRRRRKRDFRRLWVTRISAAAKQNGLSYSAFIGGLVRRGVGLNRKMLAEIAVRDGATFQTLAEMAKEEAVKG
ncbi:50S ribosomal protein L20 [Candidatus Acetothermia bacterium]|nr:MAG: 50S ribosomal protein L20 [Candidatus Acetothermia bacterium]HHK67119.1 50S ribosomal protein L20 [Candidatus Acetothermia bacterium]